MHLNKSKNYLCEIKYTQVLKKVKYDAVEMLFTGLTDENFFL